MIEAKPKPSVTDKVIHPNSRIAAQLGKQKHRDERINRRQKEKKQKLEALGEKLTWFLSHLDNAKSIYTKPEACNLIKQYLNRFDDEATQDCTERKGKTNRATKERPTWTEMKKSLAEKEANEFKSIGLEIPNILNGKELAAFRQWDGKLRMTQAFKLRRIKYLPDGTNAVQDMDTDEPSEVDFDATINQNSESD